MDECLLARAIRFPFNGVDSVCMVAPDFTHYAESPPCSFRFDYLKECRAHNAYGKICGRLIDREHPARTTRVCPSLRVRLVLRWSDADMNRPVIVARAFREAEGESSESMSKTLARWDASRAIGLFR
jgi:hypothetical protein